MDIGSLLLNQRFAVPIVPYTEADLTEDLAQGVGNVLAGVGSDFRLDVSADTGSVLLRHKDVNTAGLGAGYTGAVRTALGITASGIIAGYNRLSDGAWVNSLVIDGTTGSATYTGAINATSGNFTGRVTVGSIIAGSVTVDGTTLSTIKSNAAAGATAVQPAAIAGMLTASSTYVLAGTISITSAGDGIRTGNIAWDANGTVNAGSGVAITSKGIVAASSGTPTFTLNGTTGAAVFKGDISGAYGTFAGGISSAGSIYITGAYSGTQGAAGVYSKPSTGSGVIGIGVGNRYGVMGYGPAAGGGVYGQCDPGGIAGVYGFGNTDGIAIYAGGSGRIALGGTGIQIRGTGGVIRATDSYSTDAYLIMANTWGTGTGSTATLGPILGSTAAMAGWITAKVGSATVRFPYWT